MRDYYLSLALQLNLERNAGRQIVNNPMGSGVKRNTVASTYQYERSYAPVSSMGVGKPNTSRSEPDLAWQRSMLKSSAPPQRFLSNMGNYRAERTTSPFITSTSSQPQPLYNVNGTSQNKTNSQFICSRTDTFKTPSKPAVTEGPPKNKGDSGWVGTKKMNMMF